MITFNILRHAQSTGNEAINRSWSGDHQLFCSLNPDSQKWPLTEHGILQAKACSLAVQDRILGDDEVYVVSSPLIRAVQTSWYALGGHDCLDKRLGEREFGSFAFLSIPDRKKLFSELGVTQFKWHSNIPELKDMEPIESVYDRVQRFLVDFDTDLKQGKYCNKHVFISSHGTIFQCIRLMLYRAHVRFQGDIHKLITKTVPYVRNCQVTNIRLDPFRESHFDTSDPDVVSEIILEG